MKVFCDDASVEKAVSSAVEKFNKRLTTGNKLALFQIQSASKVSDFSIYVYLRWNLVSKYTDLEPLSMNSVNESTGTKAVQ